MGRREAKKGEQYLLLVVRPLLHVPQYELSGKR